MLLLRARVEGRVCSSQGAPDGSPRERAGRVGPSEGREGLGPQHGAVSAVAGSLQTRKPAAPLWMALGRFPHLD